MRRAGVIAMLILVALVAAGLLWMAGALEEAAQQPGARAGRRAPDDGAAAVAEPDAAPRTRRRTALDGDVHVPDLAPAPDRGPGLVRVVVLREGEDDPVPEPGATVQRFQDDASAAGEALTRITAPVETLTTDGAGRVSFPAERGEPWRFCVRTADGMGAVESGHGPDDVEVWLARLDVATLHVVDATGAPLPDAVAYLFASSEDPYPSSLAAADEDGSIRLDPAPGMAVVTAPGHTFAKVASPVGDITVDLATGIDVAGRVVDENGAPLAGLVLLVDDAALDRRIRTDEDGRFRIERAAEQEDVCVTVRLSGRSVMRSIGYGDLDATIVIPRRGDVAGVVLMPDGTPAKGAEIEGMRVDDDGTFAFWTDGAEGDYTLVASLQGRVEGFGPPITTHQTLQVVHARRGATTDVRLVLQPSPLSFARVRLVDESGAAVACSSASGFLTWYRLWGTADGLDMAVGTEPGTQLSLRLRPVGDGYAECVADVVTSAAPDCAAYDVLVRRPGPAVLRVFAPDGEEIPRSEWTTLHVEHGTLLDDGRIDAPPGSWLRVVLEARGRRFDGSVAVPADGSGEVRVHFPSTARVTGRLVRGDGTTAAGLQVVVVPLGSRGAYPRAVSGGDGSFAVEDVPSGGALFVVWQSEGEVQAQRRTIEIPQEGTLDLGDLLAWDDVLLTGHVVAPPGESPAGISVDVLWDDFREDEHTIADADGAFRLRVPGAPDAVLRASRSGRLFGIMAVDLSRTNRADVRVQRIGAVRVRAPDAWKDESWDAWLSAPDRSVTWSGSWDWSHDGSVALLADAPAGTWIVRITRGGDVLERTVTVAPGGETSVRFDR